MKRAKARKSYKEKNCPSSNIVAIVLGLFSLATFVWGIVLSCLSLYDYTNHGIAINIARMSVISDMVIFSVIAAVILLVALLVLDHTNVSITDIIGGCVMFIVAFLVFGLIAIGTASLVQHGTGHTVQNSINSELESHGYENVRTLVGGEEKNAVIKQISAKKEDEGSAPSSSYATQIAYVEEEGKAKYMMIGFDEDKRMFIQYEVPVKEKSPTQAKKYLD